MNNYHINRMGDITKDANKILEMTNTIKLLTSNLSPETAKEKKKYKERDEQIFKSILLLEILVKEYSKDRLKDLINPEEENNE